MNRNRNSRLLPFGVFCFVLLLAFSSCKHDAEIPPIIAGVGDSICFESQVLPIIVSNCSMSGCHDGNGEMFSLLSYNDIKRRVTPGDPNKSKLYQVMTASQLSGSIMPPSPAERMSNAQITLFQLWIMEGAHNTNCTNYCDSIHVTFSGTIRSIVENNCKSCHSGTAPSAGLLLNTYDDVKTAMVSKHLIDHLLEQNDYSLMPQSGPLSTCNIAQFKKWYNDGLPNN
jgi:hypothetical protein